MARRNPLTQLDTKERAGWPQIKAAKAQCLGPNLRRELIQLARVAQEQQTPFIDEVTGQIIQHRLQKQRDAQEKPVAVAASMRQIIRTVDIYWRKVSKMPQFVISELAPLPPEGWFERAEEKVAQWEGEIEGHCPKRITPLLKNHAWMLQRIARTYSGHLASNRKAMQHWLEVALTASGEPSIGKNDKKAYFEALLLPEAQGEAIAP